MKHNIHIIILLILILLLFIIGLPFSKMNYLKSLNDADKDAKILVNKIQEAGYKNISYRLSTNKRYCLTGVVKNKNEWEKLKNILSINYKISDTDRLLTNIRIELDEEILLSITQKYGYSNFKARAYMPKYNETRLYGDLKNIEDWDNIFKEICGVYSLNEANTIMKFVSVNNKYVK